MKNGWSQSDVNAVKVILNKAKKAAEQEALNKFKKEDIKSLSELWDLEFKIRKWRKDLEILHSFSYENVGKDIQKYLNKKWIKESDLSSLSDDRRKKLKID